MINLLNQITGLIHIGANRGQECELYDKFDLDVLWVEAIPEVYLILQDNISAYPKQTALCALVTDVDNEVCNFNVASNGGNSSSLLELAGHKDIAPEVFYVDRLSLSSITLPSLLSLNNIDSSKYQATILDTHGTELQVLQGMGSLLKQFKYVLTEAADFEVYENCCQVNDISKYLYKFGFLEVDRKVLAKHPISGKYYDILYENKLYVN